MLKMTLWNAPRFAFEILDPLIDRKLDSSVAEERQLKGYAIRDGLISIAVITEFNEIPITVEFDRYGYDPVDECEWDRIVEVPITLKGKFMIFDDMDEFGRLELWPGKEKITDATNGNRTTSYTYDKVGNRLTEVVDGVATTSVYDNNDRITSAGATTYTYDANGSTLVETSLTLNPQPILLGCLLGCILRCFLL
jgi:YD repeat-containing protein